MEKPEKNLFRLPLKAAISAQMIFLVSSTALLIGSFSYISSKRTINDLSNKIFDSYSQKATTVTNGFLNNASKISQLNKSLVEEQVMTRSDVEALFKQSYLVLKSHPQFTWSWFVNKEGMTIGSYRHTDGRLVKSHSYIKKNGRSFFQEHFVDSSGALTLKSEKPNYDYDARKRPYYTKAMTLKKPFWMDPYLILDPINKPNITYGNPLLSKEGELLGLFTIDFQLDFLKDLVDKIQVGKTGYAFILTGDGKIIAHPNSNMILQKDGDKTIMAKAMDSEDHVVSESYKMFPKTDNQISIEDKSLYEVNADGKDFIVSVTPFKAEGGLTWFIVITVPKKEILGPALSNLRNTLYITIISLLFSLISGFILAKKITNPLYNIFDDLENIGKFIIVPKNVNSSFITEINQINNAIGRMKTSLRSFEKYVPANLVRYLMEHGIEAKFGGENTDVTIFFSDIADFTTISEQLTPNELVGLLGEYLGEMSGPIIEEKGTVDKFIGDAVMAFWGAPEPVENHAVSACRAALASQKCLDVLDKKWEQEGRPVIRSRIGLNTGEVIVGNMGSNERLNYTVIGDAVNVASRLEALNKEYGTRIMISESTYQKVNHAFETRKLDLVAVKGKTQGLAIYELVAEKGSLSESDSLFIDTFEKGVELYFEKDWINAIACFHQCLDLRTSDLASKILLLRCEEYREFPPPENWDGIFAFTTK